MFSDGRVCLYAACRPFSLPHPLPLLLRSVGVACGQQVVVKSCWCNFRSDSHVAADEGTFASRTGTAGCISREKSFSGCPLEWEWQDSPGEQTAYCGNFSFLREGIGMPRPRPYLAGGLTPQRRRVITEPVNSAGVEVRGGDAAARPFLPPVCLVYASLADSRRPGHHYRRPLPPTSLGANLPPTEPRPVAPVKEPAPARSGAWPQYQCVVVSLEFTIK